MRTLVYLFIALGSISVVAQEATSEDYIRKYHKIAIDEMHAYGIPASITLAQGILESGNGNSDLAHKSKNHFGATKKSFGKTKTFFLDGQNIFGRPLNF